MSDNTHPPRTLGHEARRTHDGCAWLSPDEPQSRWWSQTGSNRRPPACKAGALPTELWPRAACEFNGAGWITSTWSSSRVCNLPTVPAPLAHLRGQVWTGDVANQQRVARQGNPWLLGT